MTIYSHHQLQTNVTGKVKTENIGASKGVGKALYKALLPNLAQFGIHRLYAVIALPNKISMGLHQQMGFKQVAILDEVGSKFGHMISVAMLEKRL